MGSPGQGLSDSHWRAPTATLRAPGRPKGFEPVTFGLTGLLFAWHWEGRLRPLSQGLLAIWGVRRGLEMMILNFLLSQAWACERIMEKPETRLY